MLEKELCFEVWNQTAFAIPLNNLSQYTTGKNEVTLEFHQVGSSISCVTFHVFKIFLYFKTRMMMHR